MRAERKRGTVKTSDTRSNAGPKGRKRNHVRKDGPFVVPGRYGKKEKGQEATQKERNRQNTERRQHRIALPVQKRKIRRRGSYRKFDQS